MSVYECVSGIPCNPNVVPASRSFGGAMQAPTLESARLSTLSLENLSRYVY
jgi:hypothetical protein